MKYHKNKLIKKYSIIIIISFFIMNVFNSEINIYSATKELKTYTITPDSKPIDSAMLGYTTYNEHTKHYYLILSYLKQFEKDGGGTLILKKGTYTISNTLTVPSNVTIELSDGVIIKKVPKQERLNLQVQCQFFNLLDIQNLKQKMQFLSIMEKKTLALSVRVQLLLI